MNHFTKIVLDGFLNNTAQTIKVRSIVAIDSNDKHCHDYYMVDFVSSPYNLQENKTINGQVIDYGALLDNGI